VIMYAGFLLVKNVQRSDHRVSVHLFQFDFRFDICGTATMS